MASLTKSSDDESNVISSLHLIAFHIHRSHQNRNQLQAFNQERGQTKHKHNHTHTNNFLLDETTSIPTIPLELSF
ncbi:hypothetical protein glysoja_012475 [Glycine soja]|nr:hypothetical protein glysoja_012475 [Glycine soja]